MVASRARRAFSVGVAAAAVVMGVLVAPTQPAMAADVPTALSPDDPNSYPGSPVHGTEIRNVELKWSDTGAAEYRVQISSHSGDFGDASKLALDQRTRIPRFVVPPSLPRGSWAWRVKSDTGKWSDVAWFTHGWSDKPGNPQQMAGSPDGPALTWDGVPGASFYEIQFSFDPFKQGPPDDAGPGPIEDDEVSRCYTTGTSFSPAVARVGKEVALTPEQDKYCGEIASGGAEVYWRVRARDDFADPRETKALRPEEECVGVWYHETPEPSMERPNCSDWSYPADPSFSYTYDVGPVAPAKVDPTSIEIGPRASAAMGENVLVTNTPAIRWDPVAGATFYRVNLSEDPKAKSKWAMYETTATHFSQFSNLEEWPKKMYYSVQACTVTELKEAVFALAWDEVEGDQVNCAEIFYKEDDPANDDWLVYRKVTPQRVEATGTATVGAMTTFEWSTMQDTSKPFGSSQIRAAEAKGYELWISGPNGDFDRPSQVVLVDHVGSNPARSHWSVPSATLPDGWTWMVRAVDQMNNKYAFSTPPAQASAPPSASIVTKPGFKLDDGLRVRFSDGVTGVSNANLTVSAGATGKAGGTSVRRVSADVYVINPKGTWVAGEHYSLALGGGIKGVNSGLAAVVGKATAVRASTTADSASGAVSKRKGSSKWKTIRASSAVGKSYTMTAPKKAKKARKNPSWVQATVRGSKVSVIACKSPKGGKAKLIVDGKTVRTVSLYAKSTKCGVVAGTGLSESRQHTVRFQATGTKVKKSKGRGVRFDAFRVG